MLVILMARAISLPSPSEFVLGAAPGTRSNAPDALNDRPIALPPRIGATAPPTALLAMRRAQQQVLERVRAGVIPARCLRRSASRRGHGRGEVGDRLDRVANQHRARAVDECRQRLLVTQAKLRVLRGPQKIKPVGAPFPILEIQSLRLRRQPAV